MTLFVPAAVGDSRRWTWRLWALAVAMSGAVYALCVAIQMSASPGPSNLISDRVSFAALIITVYSLIGVTFRYWEAPLRNVLIVLAPVTAVAICVALFTDLVVADAFIERDALFFVGGTYWEPVQGPGEIILMAYLAVAAMFSLAYWIVIRKPERSASVYIVGLVLWIAMGVVDIFTTFLAPETPPVLATGYLVFVVLLVVLARRESFRLQHDALEFQARSTSVLAASPHPVIALDDSGDVMFANDALERVLGIDDEDPGLSLQKVFPEEEIARVRRAVERARESGSVNTLYVQTVDGQSEPRTLACSIAPMERPGNRGVGVVINLTDITERRRQEERSEYLAMHDALTGLMNRTALNARLLELITQAERRPDAPDWAVLFIDLDGFKPINDALGHHVGDDVLVTTANRIREIAPRPDLCFRLGGDEFVVVVTGVQDALDPLPVATAIVEGIQERIEVGRNTVSVSASVGVTIHPRDGNSVASVLRNADLAMYEAKASDDSIHFFTEEINSRVMERMHLEVDLRQAIRKDQLTLHYQPIVDQDGSIRELEALLRWAHPERGSVSPADFIPIAEQSGLIVEIGEWVMERAFADVPALTRRIPGVRVAINVSPIQFRQASFIETVNRLVRSSGVTPTSITFEITESALVENLDLVATRIQELRDRGFAVAIDDFGTGYSSLSYLNSLPIDKVKFDRSLSVPAHDGSRSPILEGLVRIVGSLNLRSVVEGVESTDQVEALQSVDDLWLQGFLYHRPMPASDVPGNGSESTGGRKEVTANASE